MFPILKDFQSRGRNNRQDKAQPKNRINNSIWDHVRGQPEQGHAGRMEPLVLSIFFFFLNTPTTSTFLNMPFSVY